MTMLDAQHNNETDVILHPSSRRLFRHWEAMRAEHPYPTREQFSLAPVSEILPNMIVLAADQNHDLRFKLAGTAVCNLMRENLTGKSIFANWATFETSILQRQLNAALVQYQPTLIRMRLTTDSNHIIAAELIGLPVQKRGSTEIELVGGLFPFRDPFLLSYSNVKLRELISARLIWTEHLQEATKHPAARFNKLENRNFALRVISGGKV